MQELIDKIQKEHGLTPEQSRGILNTIKNFVKEKFPMIGDSLDSMLDSYNAGTDTEPDTATGSTTSGDTGTTEGPAQKGGSFLDTESNVPGETGEKEKQAAKDKMESFVDGNKKK